MSETTHGMRRRRQILGAAADLSTAEGLESLSLSRIAAEVGLTKPGVAAHFTSKQALQLAIVESAAEAYSVWFVAAEQTSEPGLSRLRALVEAWLEHIDRIDYRSGCFFSAAGHDFSGRPGPVRQAIARHTRRLEKALAEHAALADRLGELRDGVSPDALAFTLHALALEANLRRELLDDDGAFRVARVALREVLERASNPSNEEISR